MSQHHPLYFNMIVLVLLMMMNTVKTHITDGSFDKVEPGQSIMGRVGSDRPARTNIQCSIMCLFDDSCQGYQYKDNRTGLGKCILIHNGCKENVQSSHSAVTYKKDGSWIPPLNWTGPCALLYQSFDSSDGFVLMEGTEATSDSVPLVSGKVNNAWSLNRTKNQWVDLGIHIEACMTQPETCGAAGGAISLWVKIIDCNWDGGIASSFQSSTTGSQIVCFFRDIGLYVDLCDGYFEASHTKPPGWRHVVLNYIGPNDGEGIRMYFDGAEVASGTDKHDVNRSAGDGRIVVGRLYTNLDQNYASVEVDELVYFNAALTSDDVLSIYNSA